MRRAACTPYLVIPGRSQFPPSIMN